MKALVLGSKRHLKGPHLKSDGKPIDLTFRRVCRLLFCARNANIEYLPDEIDAICREEFIAFMGYVASFQILNSGDVGVLLKVRRGFLWCQSLYSCALHVCTDLLELVQSLEDPEFMRALDEALDPAVFKKATQFVWGLLSANFATVTTRKHKTEKASKGPSKDQPTFTFSGYRVACECTWGLCLCTRNE